MKKIFLDSFLRIAAFILSVFSIRPLLHLLNLKIFFGSEKELIFLLLIACIYYLLFHFGTTLVLASLSTKKNNNNGIISFQRSSAIIVSLANLLAYFVIGFIGATFWLYWLSSLLLFFAGLVFAQILILPLINSFYLASHQNHVTEITSKQPQTTRRSYVLIAVLFLAILPFLFFLIKGTVNLPLSENSSSNKTLFIKLLSTNSLGNSLLATYIWQPLISQSTSPKILVVEKSAPSYNEMAISPEEKAAIITDIKDNLPPDLTETKIILRFRCCQNETQDNLITDLVFKSKNIIL